MNKIFDEFSKIQGLTLTLPHPHDLIFVKLENLANAIGSGEPNFASIVCLAGHGEIFFKEVASNIKDQYDVDL